MRKPLLRALCTAALLTAVLAFAAGAGHGQTVPAGLQYERNKEGGITVTKYTSTAAAVVIPARIEGLPVTAIGNRAFAWCDSLTSITIPVSVTSIGDYAFYECGSLTGITIPNSVTAIGVAAFYGCVSLTSITIPASVTSIGDYAFSGCSGLTSVTIGSSVTAIGRSAFEGCSGLTSITIPNSVTAIGGSAFYGCDSLTGIVVDTNNTAYAGIDGVVFTKDRKTLVAYPGGKRGAYTIPSGVTAIGDSAFRGCGSLTGVTIGSSVTAIGYAAFAYCSGLTSITIPNSVTAIGNGAFESCRSLTVVTFEGGSRISSERFAASDYYSPTFSGDLRDTYLAQTSGGGTYTRQSGGTHWTKGGAEVATAPVSGGNKAAAAPPPAPATGAGKSIAVILPKYTGGREYAHLPELVQSALITDFKIHSAFKVLDRESLNRILKETMDPTYTDTLDIVRLGHVTHTDYIVTGSIFKTGSGYTMSLHIANTRDGRINASSSGAYTLEALENLTGIRKAAAELLPQLASLGPVSDGSKQRPAERGKTDGDRLAASGGWGGRPPPDPTVAASCEAPRTTTRHLPRTTTPKLLAVARSVAAP